MATLEQAPPGTVLTIWRRGRGRCNHWKTFSRGAYWLLQCAGPLLAKCDLCKSWCIAIGTRGRYE